VDASGGVNKENVMSKSKNSHMLRMGHSESLTLKSH